MKGPQSLEGRASVLIERLTSQLHGDHSMGFMSPAIYDTAWLAMVSKPVDEARKWLFPECLQYVLDHQQDDGGWPCYASAIDGILNTAASLLCLLKHCASLLPSDSVSRDELSLRIGRAKLALQKLLDNWDVASTVHVGFEILVPAMLEYICWEGINFTFPGTETLQRINQEKLRKFRPEFLYGKVQLTALHSLEAFVGKLNFDKVAHHKVEGSFMASPSSTAAYLMNSSTWDQDCEDYLREVVELSAGNASGGVPSAWPSTTFETTWVISTLLGAGFDASAILSQSASRIVDYLHRQLESAKGVTGFAPGLGPDADDTAKSILILNLLGKPTSPAGLVKQFEDDACFKTYPLERDPSFSANVNCLIALLQAPDHSHWQSQILKILNFLCSRFEQSGVQLQDKWNISPYYSMMLLAQALSRTLRTTRNNDTFALIDPKFSKRSVRVLQNIVDVTVQSCHADGSWGEKGSREETAYAAIALASAASAGVLPACADKVRHTLQRSNQFLENTATSDVQYLWVEKVTFGSTLLSEAYVLAALKLSSTMIAAASDDDMLKADFTNGVSNGVDPRSDRDEQTRANGFDNNEASAEPCIKTNGVHTKANTSELHSRTDSVMDQVNESPAHVFYRQRIEVPAPWSGENEKVLLGPYNYLDKNPGKDIRGAFITAFNTWLHVPPHRLAVICKVIRMLHTSSLLVDDIEDNSDLRRGIPVAHSVFGIPQTFNGANYVYFQALQEVRDLKNPEALDCFVEELINLHRGQGLDLYYRDSLICPTEQEYLEMIGNKTGGLFRLAIRLMQAESPTDRDLTSLVSLLGLQFQICDDYLNLMSEAYRDNKGYCEDITEGKFSFPVIHSIRADATNKELLNILKQKPREHEIKKYAVQCMERTGSFEYTRRKVEELKGTVSHYIDECERKGWGDASGIRKLVSRLDISQ